MNTYKPLKCKLIRIITIFCIFCLVFNIQNAFSDNFQDGKKFLLMNNDKVSTTINVVNKSLRNNSNIKVSVFENSKEIILKELILEKESKASINLKETQNISKVKSQYIIGRFFPNNSDVYFNVEYSFKNDNGKVSSTINYNEEDFQTGKSYFVVNKFIYPKLKNVKIYLYNVDDSDFEGTLERYQTIGKFKSKEEFSKIKKGEEKVFDFKKAAQGTFVINPKNKTKYIAFLKLEYKNGKFEIVKPSDTFKKTSLLKSEGVLTLVNTSDDYMLLGYEVYDKGVLNFKGEFAFIPKAQKFIDLGDQTSHLESPVIRLLSSNINKSNKFKDSLIAAQINTKIKRKNLSYNFRNIKGEAGTKLTLGYNFKEDRNGYLNLYNEEDEDAKVKIVTDSNKNALELEVKANDILQVPLNEVLKGSNNYNNKETGIINVESTNQKNISVKLESLKQGEKEGLINVLRAKNIRALLNSNTDDFLVDAPNEPFEGTTSTTQSINKKLNFKATSTSSVVKELIDKWLGFSKEQIKKIQEATERLAEEKGDSRDNGEDLIKELECTPRQRVINNGSENKCKDCPSNSHREKNDPFHCACDVGYSLKAIKSGNKEIKKCEKTNETCPENSTFNKDTGRCNCLFGYCENKNGNNYTCENYFENVEIYFEINEHGNKVCKKCGENEVSDGNNYGCKCKSGFGRAPNNTCIECDVVGGNTGECKCKASEGYYWKREKEKYTCARCDDNNYISQGKCVMCEGTVINHTICKECGDGGKWNNNLKQCECDPGYGWDALKKRCVKCAANEITENKKCEACKKDLEPNKDQTECICKVGFGLNDRGGCDKCDIAKNMYSKNGKCVKCDSNKVSGGSYCYKCQSNQYMKTETSGQRVCKSCGKNMEFVDNKCVCKDGYAREDGVSDKDEDWHKGCTKNVGKCGDKYCKSNETCTYVKVFNVDRNITRNDTGIDTGSYTTDEKCEVCPNGIKESTSYLTNFADFSQIKTVVSCKEIGKEGCKDLTGAQQTKCYKEYCEEFGEHMIWNNDAQKCECDTGNGYYNHYGKCEKVSCKASIDVTWLGLKNISMSECISNDEKSFECCVDSYQKCDDGKCVCKQECGSSCCLDSETCFTSTKNKNDTDGDGKIKVGIFKCVQKCETDEQQCHKFVEGSDYSQTWCCPKEKICGDKQGECFFKGTLTKTPNIPTHTPTHTPTYTHTYAKSSKTKTASPTKETEATKIACQVPMINGTPYCLNDGDCCGGMCIVSDGGAKRCIASNDRYLNICKTNSDCNGLKCERGKCTTWITPPVLVPTVTTEQTS